MTASYQLIRELKKGAVMKSENKLTSDRQPSPRPKPDVSSTSRMLSPAELAQLRQNGKTTAAYAQKEFKENPLKM